MEQNIDTGAPIIPVLEDKQKSNNVLKVATVVACIVAICGIGFGVYGMMQSAQKDNQISDLKVHIGSNEEKNVSDANDGSQTATTVGHEARSQNPIIPATTSEGDLVQTYTITKKFHIYDYETGKNYSLGLSLRGGSIVDCELSSTESVLQHECSVLGISGKIYKTDYLAHGQAGNPLIVFIMQDGTVRYFPLDDALKTTDISTKQLNVYGFVTDVIDEIGAFAKRKDAEENEGGSGYVTSALIYSDGTYDTYDSLLNKQRQE